AAGVALVRAGIDRVAIAGTGNRVVRFRALARRARSGGAHDVQRPDRLPAGRHPGEGGPRQHGRQPGSPRAVAGPPRRGTRVANAVAAKIARWAIQMVAAPGAGPVRAPFIDRPSQEGLQRAHRSLVAWAVARVGGSAARRAAVA